MSSSTKHSELVCEFTTGNDVVDLLIKPKEKDIGGFSVRRALPNARHKMIGPWIFFDHMGPARFAPGEGINVRPHPHINLATVTYLFEGEILHRDSLGSLQTIRPGDINLMVAGRGIVHSERESPELKRIPRIQHGLQLWLALPDKDEEIDPAFYHYSGQDIPSVTVNDVRVRVMMGSAFGVASPVKTFAETLYLEAELQAGQLLKIPPANERGMYVVEGRVEVGKTGVEEHVLAILKPGGEPVLKASAQSRIAIIGGEHVGQRYIEWNFISSQKQRIERAKRDWKQGNFPKVPGDDQEYIPLPT